MEISSNNASVLNKVSLVPFKRNVYISYCFKFFLTSVSAGLVHLWAEWKWFSWSSINTEQRQWMDLSLQFWLLISLTTVVYLPTWPTRPRTVTGKRRQAIPHTLQGLDRRKGASFLLSRPCSVWREGGLFLPSFQNNGPKCGGIGRSHSIAYCLAA